MSTFARHTTIGVIQARMTSERLPGKVLRDLGGRPVLAWVVRAAQESDVLDDVVVATSTDPTDDAVVTAARDMGARVVRGPMDDVLSRFAMAIDAFSPDALVRLTGDNPLVDPAIIRMVTRAFDPASLDYLSTSRVRTLPLGLDVEICSSKALLVAAVQAAGADRAHVTSYLYRESGRFRTAGIMFESRGVEYRLTLDTREDAQVIEAVVAHLGDAPPSVDTLIRFLDEHPEVAFANQSIRQKALNDG